MCHSAFFPYASSAVRDSLWQRLSATARLAIKSHHSALCLISLSSTEMLQQFWTHESFGKQVSVFEGLHLSSHQSSYILVLVVGEEVRSCRFHIPEFSFRHTKVQTIATISLTYRANVPAMYIRSIPAADFCVYWLIYLFFALNFGTNAAGRSHLQIIASV